MFKKLHLLQSRKFVISICLVSAVIITILISHIDYNLSRPNSLAVTMEAKTSNDAIVKIYFDTGKGYSEKYSSSLNIVPNSLHKYSFLIPGKNIKSFRLDPAERGGKFKIININIETKNGSILKTFSLNQLKPIQQIADFKVSKNICSFDIPVNATDPILELEDFQFSKADNVICYFIYHWWIIILSAFISFTVLYSLFIIFPVFKPYINLNTDSVILSIVIIIFAGLITLGITGSSLQLLLEGTSSIIDSNMTLMAFKPQGVRSDEVNVGTPWIIAQANHHPPFPILNNNIGIEGQNMLVAGSGSPVKHLSLIAKPSTWGFFFLDLKRALSWSWFFPVFAGLLSLWWVFNILLPSQSTLNFFLSLLFLLSAYVTVWSMSPISPIFFLSIALCLTILIFRQEKWIWLPLLGLLLGISISGFALILYPPWQIPLAYLYLFIFIGVFLRDRLYRSISIKTALTFILGFLVAGIILWSWWIDAKQAVEVMTHTVYPGSRFDTGGDISILWLLRGFTNIASIYSTNISNKCEIASFYYLFLPIAAAIYFRVFKGEREIFYTLIPVGLFMIFCLIFMLFGVPEFIAKYTFLYMAPAGRADLALGLSYFLMCGIVLSKNSSYHNQDDKHAICAYIIAFIWTATSLYVIYAIPTGAFEGVKKLEAVWVLVAVFFSSVWLIMNKTKYFILMSLALSISTVIHFNPLSIAPNKVKLKKDIRDILSDINENQNIQYKRVLFIGKDTVPSALYAAGIPNVTGDFMYPQMKFWNQLDPAGKYSFVYNRYEQLFFTLGEINNTEGFIINLPQLDMVTVEIDGNRFNFALTGAEIVIVPDFQAEQLKHNQSIEFIKSVAGYSWFEIKSINK